MRRVQTSYSATPELPAPSTVFSGLLLSFADMITWHGLDDDPQHPELLF